MFIFTILANRYNLLISPSLCSLMTENRLDVPPPVDDLGVHMAIHVLDAHSCAILVREPLDIDGSLPDKYFKLLGTSVRDNRKYDCVFILPENAPWGLFTVDPSTKLLSRHPKLPLGTPVKGLFIRTAFNQG